MEPNNKKNDKKLQENLVVAIACFLIATTKLVVAIACFLIATTNLVVAITTSKKNNLGYSSLEALDSKVSMVLASTVSCDRSFQSLIVQLGDVSSSPQPASG